VTKELIVEHGPEHAVLTFNRPERRNALSVILRDAISDALDELATDATIKTVVLTGAGTVFSAGFDLKEFEAPRSKRGRGSRSPFDRLRSRAHRSASVV
jgi:enoyl-CoA hydratase/carnithine racemase